MLGPCVNLSFRKLSPLALPLTVQKSYHQVIKTIRPQNHRLLCSLLKIVFAILVSDIRITWQAHGSLPCFIRFTIFVSLRQLVIHASHLKLSATFYAQNFLTFTFCNSGGPQEQSTFFTKWISIAILCWIIIYFSISSTQDVFPNKKVCPIMAH